MPEGIVYGDISKLERTIATLPESVIRGVMRDVGKFAEREMLRRYRRTTNTWSHKPKFSSIREETATSYTVVVGTDDEIYGYVEHGTRPHIIEPRGPGYPLRFRSKYKAKTMPGFLGSRSGGASGAYRRAWAVFHPGTKPRGFTPMIEKEVGPLSFEMAIKRLDKYIRRAFSWAQRRA